MSYKKALLIIDHGSRNEEANQALLNMAEVLRDLLRKKFGQKIPGKTQDLSSEIIVEIAHMELAEPDIAAGFRACIEQGACEIIVHPYMLSPGRHVKQDIPRLLEETARAHSGITYRLVEPLGIHEKIGEVVLERAGLTILDSSQSSS